MQYLLLHSSFIVPQLSNNVKGLSKYTSHISTTKSNVKR